MIKSFKHKGLKQLFETGNAKGVNPSHASKLSMMLEVIDNAEIVEDFKGLWKSHELKGKRQGVWAMTVSGNWRLTFEFKNGNAYTLNYEDYH